MERAFVLLLLAAVCIAFDPHDILPCAFQMLTFTHIYSDGAEIAHSEDAVYHDHDNLWRWDSDFSGVPGFFDEHVWSMIWRPDEKGCFYYDEFKTVDKCKMYSLKTYPYPMDWILSKMDSVDWTEEDVTYNDKPATRYSANGKSTIYKFTIQSDLYILKSGELVYGNGTVQSSMVDIEFTVDVNMFVSNSAIQPALFMPAKPCDATPAPADPSPEFVAVCYHKAAPSSGGSAIVMPSILVLLATLVAALLICVAL